MKGAAIHESTAKQNSFTIVLAVLGVCGLFVVGYYAGGKQKAGEDIVIAATLKSRSDAVHKGLAVCESKVNYFTNVVQESKSEARQLLDDYKRLQSMNYKSYEDNDHMERKFAECMETLMHLWTEEEAQNEKVIKELKRKKEVWTEQDAQNEKVIKELKREQAVLRKTVDQLKSTRGMRYLLLYYNVQRMTRENAALRKALEMEAQPEDTESFLKGLVRKWRGSQYTNRWHHVSDMMPGEMSYINETLSRLQRTPFRYDAQNHTEIFVQKYDTEKLAWNRPTWKNRVGSQDPTVGTYVTRRFSPMNRFPNIVQQLYPIALCAYNNDIMNFTYPNTFIRMPASGNNTPDLVSRYVDTPLLTFCTDCMSMYATQEFRLLCSIETNTYGTYKFWAMRSLLRFKPQYLALAKQTASRWGFDESLPYLTINWRTSPEWARGCSRVSSIGPRRVFRWIQENYQLNGSAVALGPRRESCKQSVRTVSEVVKAQIAKYPEDIKGVYLTTEHGEVDAAALEKEWGVPVKVRENLGTVEEDVVDLLISAGGRRMIANRYSVHSEVVTEMYLLRNNFDISGLNWW